MESRKIQTPQKATARLTSAPMQQGTPQNTFRPRPASETPKSVIYTRAGYFPNLPVLDTPPSRFPKVVNPFESGLAERLHLPLICSPSIFQRKGTPQHSSTKFEWTIEEVSSLGPANVEADETQFQATPDPDLEAKAQAAISSYFKEQIIVPSPVECQLRSRKLPLDNLLNNDSPPVRSGRRIRDGVAQTIMTIPPIVAPEIENMLNIFLNYNVDQQQSPTVSCDITVDYEAQDISLRRKLFGVPFMYKLGENKESSDGFDDDEINAIHVEHSPPPKTPDLQTNSIPLRGFGIQFGNNPFGELSPISKLHSNRNSAKSPTHDDAVNKSTDIVDDDYNFGNDINVFKSIQQSPPHHENQEQNNDLHQHNQSLYRSTPDRSIPSHGMANMSVDGSFKKTVARPIASNSSRSLFHGEFDNNELEQSFHTVDDDDMQISQLSVKSTSSSGSSQHSDTPIRRRNRSASRKNLSRSFSCPVTDDEDEMQGCGILLKRAAIESAKSSPEMFERPPQYELSGVGNSTAINATEKSVFYRTDSGFNEMTTQDESKFRNDVECLKRSNVVIMEADVSMMS